jgi:alpha-glucosidase
VAEGVTTQLLEMGIDSTWNDNNEFEVWDGEARCWLWPRNCHQTYSPGDAAADDARLAGSAAAFAPEKRPYLISRSGCAGMQRYVQTWSGDNRTNWDTLRYNTAWGWA